MKHKQNTGFTIVELLVVIAIVVALAALTIFAFGSWRTRTAQTEMKQELSTASTTLKNYLNFKNAYPATLSVIPYTGNANINLTYTLRGDGLSYCLNAGSVSLPTAPHWYIDSSQGLTPTTVACS